MRSPARWLICGAAFVALGGCYVGAARPFTPATFAKEPGWVSVDVDAIEQQADRDCGAAVAAVLLGYWGVSTSQMDVRVASGVPAERGLSAGFLRRYLHTRGLQAFLIEGTFDDLEHELESRRPVLLGVYKPSSDHVDAHYLVVVGFNRSRKLVVVLDPAGGWRQYSFEGLAREWDPTQHLTIVAFPLH